MPVPLLALLALLAFLAPPLGAQVEAISLLGDSLRRPTLAPDVETLLLAQLDSARSVYQANPNSADAIIWLGRRTAYLGRFRDAIAIYTEGIQKHPDDARLYRHRGHRYITVRQLADAVGDLRRAAELTRGKADEVEQDGQPNARNIPTSTLQSNIWYHYGLVLYLQGDFPKALEAYRECMKVSKNPDMLVATSHWLYMTLRRLGQEAEAAAVLEPITRQLDVIENGEYHRLLLMYKGEIPADSLLREREASIGSATAAYGVGNWHLYNGRSEVAERIFQGIVATGPWAAFGYIAAEAELARSRR